MEPVADLLMRTVGAAFQQAILAGTDRLTLVGIPEPLAARATLEDVTFSALLVVHGVVRQATPTGADELLSRQCSDAIRAAVGHGERDDA